MDMELSLPLFEAKRPTLQRQTFLTETAKCLPKFSLSRGIYLDFISQAPLQHIKPNGSAPANGIKRHVPYPGGGLWKRWLSSFISFPSASWTLGIGISVTMKTVINSSGRAEPKDGNTTLKKPLTHLKTAPTPATNQATFVCEPLYLEFRWSQHFSLQ